MKTKYLAFAAAAFMLASCSNDEDFTPQVDNLKDTPITVTAGVEGMKTRAGHDADNLPAKFYLTVTQTEEASQYNYTNVEMTKGDANDYSPESPLLWKDGNHSLVEVNAYTIEGTAFTVQTDQSTTDGVLASDLLGAIKKEENSNITISGDNIGISFRHLLCKLDVTYSWGTEFDNVTTKSIKSVVYNGFGTDAVLDRTTATITSGTYTDAITTFVGKTTINEVEKDMSEAIFAPQTVNPKIVITALIDGVERVFSLNVTAPTGGFVSGNRYTMSVAIGGTSVEDESVTATVANGWGENITGNMATN